MMTANNAWQAIGNAENLPKVMTAENNPAAVKLDTTNRKQQTAYTMKVITPKRYSFDDNGGGYEGL